MQYTKATHRGLHHEKIPCFVFSKLTVIQLKLLCRLLVIPSRPTQSYMIRLPNSELDGQLNP